ncbi:LytTR family DNA-binding domain-containing protein [uncultured Kriegella sp.]|uniref:LytR/AlgR family response regulator transcription factor n=1 Tax=uncultured Kriegella sp. TaxID=1798910 RepID=UPI0030D73220|tara:strand:- start:19930 stop:20691 length:762 start_codon:yes stop_codon:yes gene_type:complete
MKVVIVEDEIAASENLVYLLHAIDKNIEVIKFLDSVSSSIAFFSHSHDAELVFMDIHLADGLSFEIFDKVAIDVPVIFTTAYDQYTLKAFKVNSIDYLLKPIDEEELSEALNQFETQNAEKKQPSSQMEGLLDLIKSQNKSYKTTFLVNQRDQLIPLKTEKIAFFHIDTGVIKAVTSDSQSYLLETKLEDIEHELDPNNFYRVNRQFIIHRDAITTIKYYFNGKLIVNIKPEHEERIIVSKAKATEFKKWMDS